MIPSSLNVITTVMNYLLYTSVLVFGVRAYEIEPTNSTLRQHKVHNIVLYPDKHSWCTSTPIKQVISDVDCDPVEIDNLVCLGACFSYSIPRTVPANNGDEVNSYCDSCQPVNTLWIPVKLKCSDGSNHTKRVQLIKECRCSSCNRHWELENPPTDFVDEGNSIQTSRYMQLMKLEQNENDEDEQNSQDAVSSAADDIQDAANLTKLAYEKNIWIRGPHHSKVLLRKENTMSAPANVAANDDIVQQYLGEDAADKNDKL
uniref:Neuroblastoma suppressor of tumorigenicity 1 n=1 Tax=Melanaphis sacchari TaxID=742174 RepID=A0A2H8TV44_9HEMI